MEILNHLDKVECTIKGKNTVATVYKEKNSSLSYLIQDHHCGTTPSDSKWRKYGKHSWAFKSDNPGLDQVKFLKVLTTKRFELWTY